MTEKEIQVELLKCEKSFLHFLAYCRIVESPAPHSFELYPHTKEVIKALMTQRLIDIIKSKQVGMSWLIGGAWALWNAMFKYGFRVLMYSAGEAPAIELMSKGKQIYEHLPEWLKIKTGKDSTMLMTFPLMKSQITAYPSTENAGLGERGGLVLCDEWAFHPCAEANYYNSKATVDGGGQFVGMTTVDPQNPDSLATSLFLGAPENGFYPIFIPWDVMPGRDQIWYEGVKRSVPVRNLNGLTPELYMAKNYPKTIEDALSVPGSIAAFDASVLDFMKGETKNSITKELNLVDLDSTVIHIYKPFSLGNYYIAASDTSHGVGQDYSVTGIMNVKTGEVVADIFSNTISNDEFTAKSIQLLKVYSNPKWFPEDNESGRVIINIAQRIGYSNFGYQDVNRTKIGFHTGQNRWELLGELQAAINNRQIIIYNYDGLKQFYDVIRNPKKEGRIEARNGRHDDYPVMVAICWLKRNEVATVEYQPHTIQSLHFGNTELPAFIRRRNEN